MKKKTNKVSLGDIAQLAVVSTSAVSLALQNKPGVGPATRARILRLAEEAGYVPDARLSSLMAQMRNTTSQDLLPIAWLNTASEKDAWRRYRFHTPYIEGARTRALELGYKLEEIWSNEPGMTMRRLSRVLYQRGIEGVVVTHPARHLRLDWDRFACVAMGANLLAPRLHRIMPDLNFNLLLALKSLKRLGHRRIGVSLTQDVETGSQYTVRATAHAFYLSVSPADRVPPLFHPSYWKKGGSDREKEERTVAWIKRHQPDVIVGHDYRIKDLVEAAGFRIPGDVSLVHLAVDDDVLDWAGVHSRRREMGATAVEWLVSLMRNHQFGVPKTPLNISVRGSWQNGKTLKASRPKGKKEGA